MDMVIEKGRRYSDIVPSETARNFAFLELLRRLNLFQALNRHNSLHSNGIQDTPMLLVHKRSGSLKVPSNGMVNKM
jgi:hypothetical protein